jgi:hypothetical protein
MVSLLAQISDNRASTRSPDASSPETNSPEALAAAVTRAKLLMLISAVTTAIAIAAVVGVIGYRVFSAGGSVIGAPLDGIITLPKGARVISTGVSGGRIVVTFDVNGASEMRVFDIKTLKQTGRLRFATEP